jgi:phosphatidate cytidylyltransferase
MIRNRILSSAILVPIILLLAYLGGVWFLGLILLALTLAAREYALMLRHEDGGPPVVFVLAIVWLLVVDAGFPEWQLLRPGLTLCVLGMLTWAIVRYERGHTDAVADWAWTGAGGLYLGWLGAHFVLLRNLGVSSQASWLGPTHGIGASWAVLALGVAWLADTGAFLTGRKWGKTKFSPRVSPFKTWEGYAGGIAWATVSGVLIVVLMHMLALFLGDVVRPSLLDGAVLGLLISLLAPLGDLGESLIKRHAGAKDSSQLIPGHGGMFDRIDSLLWAAVIAFYYATWIAR